ncbi:TauD/TfdA family dioxygenase [Actinoallomurus spadix]|uniref:Clavaminate synthase family protein n=1 Tax=Actinoallomurus spadix TaxID=79912 RepID=A0ABN0XVH5_9ACTN|nr:TauD/TfdA family dioxygenase [Actinoallomurus spadix]MCO5991437.1 TauD/TfdA family dioxygenase [Actinoallomurus spadix]
MISAAVDDCPTITLTKTERDDLASVAARAAATPPRLVDDSGWVATARALSCRLPPRLNEELRRFRHDPGPDGLILVRNLPVDDVLRATPSTPGSVERTATREAAAQVLITLQLGEVVAFRNEKAGALVQNVVPVPAHERQQSNAGSTRLEMHVENAFHPHRPDLVALMCLRNDHENRAGLRIASIRRAAVLLPGLVRRVLAEPRFVTEPPPSFGGADGEAPAHPVLAGAPDDPDVRVDFSATRPLDDDAGRALETLREAFDQVARTIVLTPGDLALVDNRLAIHGRTAFTPRYDGNDRWLYRTFVHLNHRVSRASRTGNGNVLD